MKKKFYLIAVLLIGIVSISIVSAYTPDGTFSLTSIGSKKTSSDKTVEYNSPWITINNYNGNTKAQLAVTLEKKGLLGSYSNKGRQQAYLASNGYTFYWHKTGKGTYRSVYLYNAGSGNLDGSYYMLSNYEK